MKITSITGTITECVYTLGSFSGLLSPTFSSNDQNSPSVKILDVVIGSVLGFSQGHGYNLYSEPLIKIVVRVSHYITLLRLSALIILKIV